MPTTSTSSSRTFTQTQTQTTPATSVATTEALDPDAEKVNALLGAVSSSVADLAAKLSESNGTTLTESVPGGIISASKLSSLVVPDTGRFEVTVPNEVGVDISVSLPGELLDVIAAEGLASDGVMFVAGAIDPEVSGLRGSTTEENADETQSTVQAVMFLEFSTLSGRNLKVSKLSDPIEFSMPVNYTARSSCAFWNDTLNQWSSEGVTTSPKSQPGELVVCLTEHLSLFGSLLKGILSALLCSQFSLLNSESIANMVVGEWYKLPGAVMYWCTLAFFVTSAVVAFVLDARRGKLGQYRSAEFFLYAQPAKSDSEHAKREDSDDDSQVSEEHHGGVICCLLTLCMGCVATVCACFHQTAARDALDEVCSNWFEQFSEVRTLLETLWDALEIGALSAGRLFQLSHSVMCRLTTVSSRRLTGASLGFSDDMVSFILEDEDVLELLMSRYHTQIAKVTDADGKEDSDVGALHAGDPVRPRWWSIQDNEEAWYVLHLEVVEEIQSHVGNHSMSNVPCMVWMFFVMHNPLGLIFCHDLFFSCKLRWLFHTMEINGSLLVTCVFFEASGSLKGRGGGGGGGDAAEEEDPLCDGDEEDIGFLIGRALVVGIMAVLLAGLPVMLLQSLHTRSLKIFESRGCQEWNRQLRAWFLQDAFIWLVGSLYLAFTTFFVLLFVANISDEDHEEFVQTGLVCYLQNLIVLPLATAFTLPAIASLLLHVNGAIVGDRSALVRDIHCDLHSNTNVMLPIERV